MAVKTATIRTLLVESGLMSPADFSAAETEAAQRSVPVDDVIVEKNFVSEEQLGRLVADELGYPYVNVKVMDIPPNLLNVIPERVARKQWMVAFGEDESGRTKVAMRDPENLEQRMFLAKKLGAQPVPHYATASGIMAGIDAYSRDIGNIIETVIKEAASKLRSGGSVEDDGTVVRVLDFIMRYAHRTSASDVHMEPHEKSIVVRFRIDGIMHDVVQLPKEFSDSLITRVKILAKLRTDEHFAAQDGKFQFTVESDRVDIRVSILPTVEGEKIVMRLLSERGKSFTLQGLGFDEKDMITTNKHAQKSFGAILATGPTGSGKTTTMYAILKILNTRDINIATIEDPIEYAIDGVNQIQVNAKSGITFAAGLRSIVRQDPDVIMVGEIRDEETAGIAVNAAMTGHLVLSTLHTNDAATTLPRFIDMKIEPFLIASTINLIIAQRLVRKVCSVCIVSYVATRDEVAKQLRADLVARIFRREGVKEIRLYKGHGCSSCAGSGYRGRIGIYELLEMSDAIRALIMRSATAQEIQQLAAKNGMRTMLEDGIDKVLRGVTTIDEVLRVAAS